MIDSYQITITLDNETLKKLAQADYYLRCYKGVKSSIGGGLNTVCFTTNAFSSSVKVEWEEQYYGYVVATEENKERIIDPPSAKKMNLNDQMSVQDSDITEVTSDGPVGYITIENMGTKEWICGVCQCIEGERSVLCSLPLFGLEHVFMQPIEKVLLVFDSGLIRKGTVVEKASDKSIIIDFTTDKNPKHVQVSYDMDTGWDKGNFVAEIYRTETIDIASKLIEVVPHE